MSLFTITLPGLSFNPGMRIDDATIRFRTGWIAQLVCLFSWAETVELDRANRRVRWSHRSCWFRTRSGEFAYSDVREIFFETEVNRALEWGFDQTEYVWLTARVFDHGEHVQLLSFWGEGSRETGLLGVLRGDSVVDFRGNHAEAAIIAREQIELEIGLRTLEPKTRY